MPSSGSLREQLKTATQSHHNMIEAAIPLMRTDVTMIDYVAYLRAFYGYYISLEPRLIAADLRFFGGALHLTARRKSPWLEQDIKKICGCKSVRSVLVCKSSPAMDKAARVVGCSYVIEGSTLGASVIYRHMHKYLGVTPDNGARFIYGYGEHTGVQWNDFVATIDALTFNSLQRDDCIASAIATFETMNAWLGDKLH